MIKTNNIMKEEHLFRGFERPLLVVVRDLFAVEYLTKLGFKSVSREGRCFSFTCDAHLGEDAKFVTSYKRFDALVNGRKNKVFTNTTLKWAVVFDDDIVKDLKQEEKDRFETNISLFTYIHVMGKEEKEIVYDTKEVYQILDFQEGKVVYASDVKNRKEEFIKKFGFKHKPNASIYYDMEYTSKYVRDAHYAAAYKIKSRKKFM